MGSTVAASLGLRPTVSSSSTQHPGRFLYIHVDGYNQTLHSVVVEELDEYKDLYAEESEPIELGITIDISESNDERTKVFEKIFDGSIIRALIELEPGYLKCKNAQRESQGIDSDYLFYPISPCNVDLIELEKTGDWEGLYCKISSLEYIGECDEYEYEEDDINVFTAGYTIESVKGYAIADVFEDGDLKTERYSSSKEVLRALEKLGIFSFPGAVEEFKSKYSGKTFALFGKFDWCEDTERLKMAIESLGVRFAGDNESPEILFIGEIDISIDGILEKWETLNKGCPIQHRSESEPLLREVCEASL